MATLVIIEGQSQGSQFKLTAPLISVGREETCTFQVLDDEVSRKHLQLKLDPTTGRHSAGDYRSANGVFVNDKRIDQDVLLADGDQIRIGRTKMMYLTEDHPDAKTAFAAAVKKGEWKRGTIMKRG